MSKNIYDFEIHNLGENSIPFLVSVSHFTSDDERIMFDICLSKYNEDIKTGSPPLSLEVAGPRKMIYFDPSKVKAGIVTCGGLCPGINDVIRALVMELYYRYGVSNITGIRYGFQGLIPGFGHDVMELNPEVVKDIHSEGGSILASSRGGQNIGEMVDALVRMNISLFFCIGGDGTMKAAELITEEITKRNLKISVISIPKTIDNDLPFISKSFGFDTAISEAAKAIKCAHVEAKGAPMGIGLVKLMGRYSGHIAAIAALAESDANFVLIPEVPFDLEGEKGFLKVLERRLKDRRHVVILVAEGAGQNLCHKEGDTVETDASGNIKLYDIGIFLKHKIEEHFEKAGIDINLKYMDPSYMIRSVPANASDSHYCGVLARYAVHAGMAGKTGMLIGQWNNAFVHFPLKTVTSERKLVDPEGSNWMQVLESTGQPPSMKNN
ncbi:MAG: ATP-dependent 6-phosphofructokinase [Syntrophales bacterium]|nr:ATP-dependent 6-phosphofructokinase [Syntrophales bacterium]